MIATYRLRDHIPSFEFFNWLVMVRAGGATEIVYDPRNPKTRKKHTDFGIKNVTLRFHSIVERGPELAGMPWRYGFDEPRVDAVASQLLPWWRSGGRFERLTTVDPAIDCKYTVTIRENTAGSARGRDSNRDAWETFASEIGAKVIDDYARHPIDLHTRVAMYAGARMNFGVCNGPVHMISLTPYPVMMWVNTEAAHNSQTRWGMEAGQSYPWMLDNQMMIWKADTIDNLRRAFEVMKL